MRRTPRSTLNDPQKIIADLKRQLAERTVERDHFRSERDEALEQQTATAEILQVINSSPGDLNPVFDVMLEKALRLCDASFGILFIRDRKLFRVVATRNLPSRLEGVLAEPFEPSPGGFLQQAIGGEAFEHIADLRAATSRASQDPRAKAIVELGDARTVLSVALCKDHTVLGFFAVYRTEVRPFTDKQIALLQNFAAQAVIAMENARLITETREALEQQTATAEVLQVINSSPGDLAPVFDAMLEKAMRLCEAVNGHIMSYDGEFLHLVAVQGEPHFVEWTKQRGPRRLSSGITFERIAAGDPHVHIADCRDTDPYRDNPNTREAVETSGIRTLLTVALRKEGALLGTISVYRREVQLFSDKQVALLGNFAAQAVIAIENARLITETREALEQQTATAEVLGVINSSPGDLAPVFDAMLEKALRLCGAAFGLLLRYDGENFVPAAHRGLPPRLAKYIDTVKDAWKGAHMRLVEGDSLVHILDITADAAYPTLHSRRALVDLGGARTLLVVALRKDDRLLGSFAVYRQQVHPFSDKQLALLKSFAAQAVIAMENARLITETRDALEQQTATAEVLGVINSSPGDLQPVFDAMLEKAMRLCEASFGELRTYEDGTFHVAAMRGVPQAYAEFMAQNPTDFSPSTGPGRILQGERLIHIVDLPNTENYRNGEPNRRALVDLGGAKTLVLVPLLKDAVVLGFILFYRQEVRPFTDKQIALLQNFAAQAVIAMENARLITETQEALEQQTATAEVLGVINASPGDVGPVFKTMLERGVQLCDARFGILGIYDGDGFRGVAAVGFPPEAAEALSRLRHPPPGTTLHQALATQQPAQVADLTTEPAFAPVLRANPALREARTSLAVPMLKDGVFVGAIIVFREMMRLFSDREIALLQNFAAQAVIAMENARLIAETREALEQQTATAEVLGVINSSPGDLTPVFQTILEKAHGLCDVAYGSLQLYEDEKFRAVAVHGLPEPLAERLRQGYSPGPGQRGLLAGEPFDHVLDMAAVDDPMARTVVELSGLRTLLRVALRKDDVLLGQIVAARTEVRPFSEKQIALLQNFAAQAVIAMENARLITETREALEQQTATAEVLGVINSSPGDLAPVFDAILEKAHRLCSVGRGALLTYDGECAHAIATHGIEDAQAALLRSPFRPLGNSPHARVVREKRVVHIPDLATDVWERDDPRRIGAAKAGVGTMLFVPLHKDDAVLGWISANRLEVRPFSEKEIALLQSFAAQAVIAIDNARLLNEIRQRQAELRVTFDNMGDGVAMFDADLQLAAWNLNFQRVLDLPDELLAVRPSYTDYIRLLAERGEFGTDNIEAELSSRLEHTDEELRLERTRPDGHVIEVRRNAVPGGGFVLIYSDVTERKRAEAEIRAARDAAEVALRELQTAQTSLVHAQKMAALGQLTAGIAHEIKNPLNFVNNFAGLSVELLDELKETAAPGIASLDEDTRAEVADTVALLTSNLEKIAEHGQRADNIVKSMLEHSRGGSGERREVDLNALIDEALNLAYHGARAQDQSFNITMEREFDQALAPVEVVPQDVTRVFLNLFGNGFYAAQKKGGDHPVLRVMTRDLGEVVEIRVRDNGTGIPPEIRDKLFQPFVTTKPTGEGTGLGLSISYEIVTQQHGGTIEVESGVGEFTEFTVRLPRRGNGRGAETRA